VGDQDVGNGSLKGNGQGRRGLGGSPLLPVDDQMAVS